MKKLLLLLPMILMLAACEQMEVQPTDNSLASLSEEIALLKKETVEDLGMSEVQHAHLHKAFVAHGKLPEKPGYLWLVARHLQENLPALEKDQLLDQIAAVEEQLAQNGQCIPLGLEVNHRHPIGPHPDLIAPILLESQKELFRTALQQYQHKAKELIQLRIKDQIAPPQFYGAMQANFNTLMTTIVGNILLPPQREQLVKALHILVAQREQYILKSYECMAPALGLVEKEVQRIVEDVMAIENQKQDISQAFHNGDISMQEAISLIQDECGNYFGNLETLLNTDQLEIAQIYRALAFRPRR